MRVRRSQYSEGSVDIRSGTRQESVSPTIRLPDWSVLHFLCNDCGKLMFSWCCCQSSGRVKKSGAANANWLRVQCTLPLNAADCVWRNVRSGYKENASLYVMKFIKCAECGYEYKMVKALQMPYCVTSVGCFGLGPVVWPSSVRGLTLCCEVE